MFEQCFSFETMPISVFKNQWSELFMQSRKHKYSFKNFENNQWDILAAVTIVKMFISTYGENMVF